MFCKTGNRERGGLIFSSVGLVKKRKATGDPKVPRRLAMPIAPDTNDSTSAIPAASPLHGLQ